MIHLHILLLLIGGYVVDQSVAQQGDQPYECFAYGDPHVVTWHPKVGSYQHYHPCYENGFFTVVKNEFLTYKVEVSKLFSINVDIYFYNGVNKVPICLILAENFEYYPDDVDKCRQHGITWSTFTNSSQKHLTISYTKANFTTNIRQMLQSHYNTRHYNIHVWQMKSLSERSTGICQRNDPACLKKPSKSGLEVSSETIWPRAGSITENQARTICKTHISTFLGKSRKAPYMRSINTNDTISIVMDACVQDVLLTGVPEMARSSTDVLMIEELTADVTSIASLKNVIETGMPQAIIAYNQAAEEAAVEIPQVLGLSTTTTQTTPVAITSSSTLTTTKTPVATTTTPFPLASSKCAVYQDMYIQTWHPTHQASPPVRTCSGTSGNFEIVKNKFVRFTIQTSGSTIDELTLIIFDEVSTTAICTVSAVGQDVDWMDCEQNGIKPSLIKTATHETLNVYYAKAKFTAIVTKDIGVNVGRFNINIYQDVEMVPQSTGICSSFSPCNGSGGLHVK